MHGEFARDAVGTGRVLTGNLGVADTATRIFALVQEGTAVWRAER